jgi:pyruvate ferredoxin oxidoreductase alpha subunit
MKVFTLQKTALTGNYAVAHAVKMAKPHVIAAYPITPQTPIVEKLAEFVEKGELNARFVNVESEFSAMSVVYGAAMAGARVFTAPIHVRGNLVSRPQQGAGGDGDGDARHRSAWNIHVEHNDILTLRDAGWIIAMAETAQEAFDLTLQAFRIAESAAPPHGSRRRRVYTQPLHRACGDTAARSSR